MPSLRRTPFQRHGMVYFFAITILPFPLINFIPFVFLSFSPSNFPQETSHWTVSPLIRDSFSMVNSSHPLYSILRYLYGWAKFLIFVCGFLTFQIGSAVGGVASAFYGFNLGMPSCSSLFDLYYSIY